ncbi:MAG: spermidine/putrescine ABC transporter substrate-binding protein [Desulfurococcales archaeon]|nr:spermidine/putrescine ABC transporter substrate-binding protein [Desulfurococcales archaeon]
MRRAAWLRVLVGVGLLLVIGALVAGPQLSASGQERVLRVYNYSEYIDYSVIDDFERMYGVEVVYDEFEAAEEAWAKLKAGGGGYDVIIIAHTHVKLAAEQGLIQPLKRELIPNLDNLDPRIASHPADPRQEYAVPYMWGTTGIAYLKSCVSDPPKTWKEFFDPGRLEPYKGKVSLLPEFSEVVEAGMIALGLNPAERSNWSEETMDRVVELVLRVKPYLAGFYGASQYIPGLVNGELCLAQAWNGDALIARDENDDVDYMVPEDGSIFWVDFIVIPRDAENVDLAHKFINFLLDPEVAARNVKAVWYASSVKKDLLVEVAKENGDEELMEVLKDPIVYPPEDAPLIPSPVLDREMQRMIEDVRVRILAGTPSEEEQGTPYLPALVAVAAAVVVALVIVFSLRRRS